jgi:hypothetical protein
MRSPAPPIGWVELIVRVGMDQQRCSIAVEQGFAGLIAGVAGNALGRQYGRGEDFRPERARRRGEDVGRSPASGPRRFIRPCCTPVAHAQVPARGAESPLAKSLQSPRVCRCRPCQPGGKRRSENSSLINTPASASVKVAWPMARPSWPTIQAVRGVSGGSRRSHSARSHRRRPGLQKAGRRCGAWELLGLRLTRHDVSLRGFEGSFSRIIFRCFPSPE